MIWVPLIPAIGAALLLWISLLPTVRSERTEAWLAIAAGILAFIATGLGALIWGSVWG